MLATRWCVSRCRWHTVVPHRPCTHGPQPLHQLHASGQGMQHKPRPELPPTGCAGVGPLITAVRMMLSHLNDARETLLLLLAIGMLQELMQTQSGKVRLPCCDGCAVPGCGLIGEGSALPWCMQPGCVWPTSSQTGRKDAGKSGVCRKVSLRCSVVAVEASVGQPGHARLAHRAQMGAMSCCNWCGAGHCQAGAPPPRHCSAHRLHPQPGAGDPAASPGLPRAAHAAAGGAGAAAVK